MKDKEHYIEEYINYLYGDIQEHDRPIFAPDIQQSKQDFKAGFNLAEELFKPKWISTETPPNDDREVIIYVRNHRTPWWSGNMFGNFIDGKWYLQNGILKEYELVRWTDINEDKEELKTVDEWGKIFNKIKILYNDGFRSLQHNQKISEIDYISILLNRCTNSL